MEFTEEIKRRRTFAIIAHPDGGKTTLTEKLLLFGGAIHIAGAVKSNKIKKGATSDFMEIERQRGISVSTSVMAFEYGGLKINILDTPGHEDFAEDTYRTLSAVDSAIVVIDSAKGVESQTRKLMEVCRMRKTPVMVFVNKMDRIGKDPFELLDEIEEELKIKVTPMTFPIGNGDRFKGVYDFVQQRIALFYQYDKQRAEGDLLQFDNLSDPNIEKHVGETLAAKLREDVELIEAVYPTLQHEDYLAGNVAPVFFGSALNTFGVREVLDTFCQMAPHPRITPTDSRTVDSFEEKLTAFIFKIHANMDPNHRNRLAFLKICSGKFERNKPYYHVRLNKYFKYSSPNAFLADKKEIVDVAYAGDIVGLPDTGNFKIGDSVTEGEKLQFKGIPSFSPEQFRYIENADPMKSKQLAKGVDQLMDEGIAQLFTARHNGRKIIGTVGNLQFEVIEYRLEHEYGAKCRWENLPLYKACWIECNNPAVLQDFLQRKQTNIATDKDDRLVFLADSSFALDMAQEKFPEIKFYFTSEK